MRKYLVPLAAAAAVVVAPAAAQAAPVVAPQGAGITTEADPTDEVNEAANEVEDSMDWGWLGLAGLMGRNRTQHVDRRVDDRTYDSRTHDNRTDTRRDYDGDGDRDRRVDLDRDGRDDLGRDNRL
jgi:hypothetical protein